MNGGKRWQTNPISRMQLYIVIGAALVLIGVRGGLSRIVSS